MHSKTFRALAVMVAIAAVPAAFWVTRAVADGIPTGAGAMTYAGVLENASGQPLSGKHDIALSLWDRDVAGAPRCQIASPTGGHQLDGTGRFVIALSEACTTAVKTYPSLWVELTVDSSLLPRSKLGAVPYAVEADRAQTATTAGALAGAGAQQLVPSGAVIAFDLAACPAGWTAYAPAGGRAIIGAAAGLARGTTVGADQVKLSVAQMPTHLHAITDPGHNHTPNPSGNFVFGGYPDNGAQIGNGNGFSASPVTGTSKTGITQTENAGGGEAFDNRQASLVLVYCKKS